LSDLIGMPILSIPTANLTVDERREQLNRVLTTGEFWFLDHIIHLPDRGITRAMICTYRLEHPIHGRKYLLQLGFDISDIQLSTSWLRDPAVQAMHIIISGPNHVCMAATEAAAHFCGFAGASAMIGARIEDTPYVDLTEREIDRVVTSRKLGQPSCDLEWLRDASSGRHAPWSVTRIGFREGGKMLLFCPMDPARAFFQGSPIEAMHEAGGPLLSRLEFDVLLDMYSHLSPEQSAQRVGRAVSTVKNTRTAIREKFALPDVDDGRKLLSALKDTPVDKLLKAYSWLVAD